METSIEDTIMCMSTASIAAASIKSDRIVTEVHVPSPSPFPAPIQPRRYSDWLPISNLSSTVPRDPVYDHERNSAVSSTHTYFAWARRLRTTSHILRRLAARTRRYGRTRYKQIYRADAASSFTTIIARIGFKSSVETTADVHATVQALSERRLRLFTNNLSI